MTAADTQTLAAWLGEQFDADARDARQRVQMGEEPPFKAPTPAHVLAQVAAHRRIVELHAELYPDLDVRPMCSVCVEDHDPENWPCETLRILASMYAGREEWREEWAL